MINEQRLLEWIAGQAKEADTAININIENRASRYFILRRLEKAVQSGSLSSPPPVVEGMLPAQRLIEFVRQDMCPTDKGDDIVLSYNRLTEAIRNTLAASAPTPCSVCKGHGSIHTGFSGSESDGNAPEFETCDECGGSGKTSASAPTKQADGGGA